MKAKASDTAMQKGIFRSGIATVGILLIPLVAMQFSEDWDWSLSDFIIMGTLIFTTGLLLSLVLAKVRRRDYRLVLGILVLLAFLYIWAELAVGVFTNLGS
jgi:ABC-type polysaccharide/polyol phosphate export permease